MNKFETVYQKDVVRIDRVHKSVYFRRITEKSPTGWLCNSAFILHGAKVIAVDLPNKEHYESMQAEAMQLFGRGIDLALLTHPHFDHIDGLPAAIADGVPFIASKSACDWLAQDSRFQNSFGVEGTHTLRNGGDIIQLFAYPGKGHSLGDLFIHLPKERVLITGDAVCHPRNLYMSDGEFINWFRIICKIAELPCDIVIPGHEEIDTPELIKYLLDYFTDLRFALNYEMGRMTPEEIADDSQESAAAMAERIIADPDNTWGMRLVPYGIERKVREHITDAYRCLTGRSTFARYEIRLPD